MHGAPSVSYPVGRSRFAGALLVASWLLGAAAIAAGQMQGQPAGWRLAAMLALLGGAGAFAAFAWWRSPNGALAWDGESWSFAAAGQAPVGEIAVALDLQHVLLVRFSAAGATRWLWAERSARRERWDDLRRAVYSRARPQALPGAQPPAAKP